MNDVPGDQLEAAKVACVPIWVDLLNTVDMAIFKQALYKLDTETFKRLEKVVDKVSIYRVVMRLDPYE